MTVVDPLSIRLDMSFTANGERRTCTVYDTLLAEDYSELQYPDAVDVAIATRLRNRCATLLAEVVPVIVTALADRRGDHEH